jgi:ATP-binding cassette subfamily B protein
MSTPVSELAALCWPLERAGEALVELARRAGFAPEGPAGPGLHDALTLPPVAARPAELERWLGWAAGGLGIDAEAVEAPLPQAGRMLLGAGPALLRLPGTSGLVLLLGSRRGVLRLLGPDLSVRHCRPELLRDALCAPYEAPLAREIERLLDVARVPDRRRAAVCAALLAERLAQERVGGCWMLRLPPAGGWWRQVGALRIPRRVALMLALFILLYGCELLGWGLIGNAALNGHVDAGWLAAWLLLVLSMVPLRLAGGWLDSGMLLDVGQAVKRRLFAAALAGDRQEVRRQGVGHLLSRVMEAQALESFALDGGLSLLVSLVELGFAAWLLAAGAGGGLHLASLLLWLGVACLLGWRYFTRMKAWTGQRLDMTHALVERMVGHRTCLAQEAPQRRDAGQDGALRSYVQASRALDRALTPFTALVPAGWMVLGLAGLVPAFVGGADGAGLALGFGGVLLAARAFGGLAGGLSVLARAGIAWHSVAGLARCPPPEPASSAFLRADGGAEGCNEGGTEDEPAVVADASRLVVRYTPQGEPVLNGASLSIRRGERILLQGASGSGKSTLAALLSGLQAPESGLLLMQGLDRSTLGRSWHELVASAPQFHENHILGGTLGFNLLMGRNWPASEAELEEARLLCEELGLGPLLERMPSGMMQMVGETGWQLSHGERSRIFLARALLQKAPLTILDESFGALDPETLDACLACVLRRAPTLLVIAHP